MKKPTLSVLTIAVVLTPLTVVAQNIQHQQNQISPSTKKSTNAKQTINHNAYDLPLMADALISQPEVLQYPQSKTKPIFLKSRTVFEKEE